AIERGRLAEEVGDGQVEPAVAVQVTTSDTHAGQVAPLGVGGHTRLGSRLLETKATLVAEQEIGGPVVSHKEVDPLVIVEVGGNDAEPATVVVSRANTCMVRDIDKPAVVVAEDVVGHRGKLERAARHVPAGLARVDARGGTLRIPGRVVADVEVEVAIAVEVG